MKPPPAEIGGCRVVLWSSIDGRHRWTRGTRHYVGNEELGAAKGLVICRCPEGYFFLFSCDADCAVRADTWHETLEGARTQAEYEYEGITSTWVVVE